MDKLPGSSPEFRPDLPQPNSGRGYGDEPSAGRIKSVRGQRYTRPSPYPSQNTLKDRSILGRRVHVPGYKQRFMTSPTAFHQNLAKRCAQYLEANKKQIGPDDFQEAFTAPKRKLYGKRKEKVEQAIKKLMEHELIFLGEEMKKILEEVRTSEDADEVMSVLLKVKELEFKMAYHSGDQKEFKFGIYLQWNAKLLDVLKLVAPDFEEDGEFMVAVEDAGVQAGDIGLPPPPKYERYRSNDGGRGDSLPPTPEGYDGGNPWEADDTHPGGRRSGRRDSLDSDGGSIGRRGSSDSGDDVFERDDLLDFDRGRFGRRGSFGSDDDQFGPRGNKGPGGLGGVVKPPYGGREGRDEDTRSPYATGGPTLRDHEGGAEPFQSQFDDIYPPLVADSLKPINLSQLKQDISERDRQIQGAEGLLKSAETSGKQLEEQFEGDEDLLSQLGELKKQLEHGRSGIEEMKSERLRLQNEKDKLRDENASVCNDLNDRLNYNFGEYDKAREQLFSLERELEELREDLKESPDDLSLQEEIAKKERELDKLKNQLGRYHGYIDNLYKEMGQAHKKHNRKLNELRSVFAQKMDNLDARLRNLIADFEEGIEGVKRQDSLDDDDDPYRVRNRDDGNPEKEIDRCRNDLEFDRKDRLRKKQRGRGPSKAGGRAGQDEIGKLRDKCGSLIRETVDPKLDGYSDVDRQYAELDKSLQTTDDSIQHLNMNHQSDARTIESIANQEGEEFGDGGSVPVKSQLAQIENIRKRNTDRQKGGSALELELQSHLKEKERIDSELKGERDRVEQEAKKLQSVLDKAASEIPDEGQRSLFLDSVSVDMRSALENLNEKEAELVRHSQQCGEKISDLKDRLVALKSSISGFSTVLKTASKDVLRREQPDGVVNPEDLLKSHEGMDGFYDDDLKLLNSTVNLGEMLLKPGIEGEVDIHDYISTSKLDIDRSPLEGLPDELGRDLESIKRDLDQRYGRLERELAVIDEEHQSRDFARESIPPNFSDVRKEKKLAYERFCKDAEAEKQKVKVTLQSADFKKMGLTKSQSEMVVQFYTSVSRCSSRVEKARKLLEERESHFQNAIKRGSAIHLLSERSADEKVSKAHSLLQGMEKGGREVLDFCGGELVMKVVEEISEEAEKALDSVSPEVKSSFNECLVALDQLRTGNMPKSTAIKSLGQRGRAFIDQVVQAAIEDLYARAEKLNPVNSAEVAAQEQFPGGIKAARNMIKNRNIAPSVLALLNSLKPKHEGVASKVDYYKASSVGLKAIRDEFRLKSMPCMHDLLLAAQEDLKSPVSRLLEESVRQHRGQAHDRAGVLRQEKLQLLCKDLMKKEQPETGKGKKGRRSVGRGRAESIPAGYEALRTHPIGPGGEAAAYFHQGVMDAFGSARGILNMDTMASAGEDDQQVRHIFSVTGTDNLPMNTLFTDVEGAELVTSKVSGEQFIQIGSPRAQPEGVVFKKTGGGDWQVSVGNEVWTANPSFLYDHSRVHIPFEKRKDGDHKRDWIPVKNEAGETAILALRKTPGHVSYFLYEKGVGEELTPRAIRGGDFKREKTEAEFFYRAACGKAKEVDAEHSGQKASDSVERLKGAHSIPYIEGTAGQLQALYESVQADMAARMVPPPLQMTDRVELSKIQVRKSDEQQVQENKRNRKARDGSPGNLVNATEALFTKFSVAATFDGVTEAYLKECQGELEEMSPDLKEEEKSLKTFKEQAFQKMTVYQGCELDFRQPQVLIDRKSLAKGHPAAVCQNLEKVIKVTRDHRMRLTQTIPHLTSEITSLLRETTDSEALAKYTDEELVQFAISEFEEGRLPAFRGGNKASLERKADRYTQAVVDLLLSRNDLAHSRKMGDKLQGLMNKLVELDRTIQSKTMNRDAYKSTCQTLNLEMAMLATEQKMVSERLDSYSRQTLDPTNIVILGFEQGGTVLRGSQTTVVREIMRQLAHMGREPVKLIYQLGTGYGKSKTIIPITVERAFRKGCPVRVIAPVTNQAELDISLSRTFARKGIPYYTLDIMNEYAREGEQWWLPEPGGRLDSLDRIHNTILGLPSGTLPEQRGSKEAQSARGPSGISVRDVQILLQLRGRLQRKMKLSPDETVSLQKLDMIADDLIRDGKNVFDEWDRTALPNRAEELEDLEEVTAQKLLADFPENALQPFVSVENQPVNEVLPAVFEQLLEEDINRALSGFKEPAVDRGSEVKQGVTSKQIIESQGAFLIGCQNGLYLSATVGTTHTAALLSGSRDAAEVASRCNSDPMTTSPRFWHWMNNATPVFIHDSADNPEEREGGLRQVMVQSGCDKELVIFDGNDRGEEGLEAIVKDFRMVDFIRKEMGGESRGMLFYDKKKQLHKFKAGDPKYDNEGKGAELPAAEERLIRANKAKDVDVRLDRTSAVGIDPPQGRDSIGVHFGLYEDDECRLDLFKQQFGRFSRDSDNLQHQSFYVVVDVSNLGDVDETVRYEFSKAHKAAQEAESLLVKSMGVNRLSECTAEQKKALYAQLQVPPPDPTEKDKGKAMGVAVSRELDRLIKTEWKGFSPEQQNALKTFKLAQWHEKKNYLMMTAQVLAGRDVTDHTMECEESLQKGARFCEADRILAEEHKWLHGDAVKVVKGVSLKPSSQLQDKVTRDLVSDALKRECVRQLQVAPRRKLEAGGSGGDIDLQAVAKSQYLKGQVDRAIDKVASKGVSVQGYQYPVVVKRLVSQSAAPMCQQAESIYAGVCSILRDSGTVIPAELSNSNNRLIQHMAVLIDIDSNKCVDEGLETEAVLRDFYKSLVHGMRKVTFSMSKGENKGSFNKRTQQVCKDLLMAMNPVAANVNQVRLGDGWKPTFNDRGEDVVVFQWPGSKPPESAKSASMAKIKWGFLPKLAPLKGEANLQDARQKTEIHKQEASQRRNAVKFCTPPGNDEYKACIEQIRQQLHDRQAEHVDKVHKTAQRAEQRMLAQAKLMQVTP